MRSAIFLGDDPKQIIRRTRALSDDIARILADGAPAESDLAEAPILDHWVVIGRMTPACQSASKIDPRSAFKIDPLLA
ncbi:hypothetical+protein [Methylocapsa aurea]|uniref:hypothetical protein n=1 Tax=Methylocapsa aurea TaxID=663610 RepID=UPI003D18F7A8